VLIVVPPSETKAPSPEDGPPVDLAGLSFPELTSRRREVASALIATSRRPDAFERLYVRHSMVHDVAMNAHVLDLPTRPVHEVYTGPLHEGLDFAGLSDAAAARARQGVVFVSPLWGALRPRDRIPRYRLHLNAYLAGMGRLHQAWRSVLPATLADASLADELVVDLRSSVYQAMGLPAGSLDRVVVLGVDQGPRGARVGDVIAKRVRGEAAHFLLECGAEPRDPEELAHVLADRWAVRVRAPDRRTDPWSMTLTVAT
jgi:cytoplasmic iron level regulating protein YaaA (DUF328/UPF0246 family)